MIARDVEPLARIAGFGCRYVVHQDDGSSPRVVVHTYGEGSTVTLSNTAVYDGYATALRAIADDIERDL